ncbi:hypothetical protein CKM354_000012600 [Cercospora kikuchii]|uniref:Uncharacterized protein n=1 Tax=Cercospora kikuchii TaxID=84275 RepID=A0A9P3C4Q7_9PEZI|nr:uncharacterized protein CKM354_000012600 [Cercospora kikuchii]GIZ36657.1 hypothetical protein CKM354_000012600 [Cercospora kikuchii]
MYTAFVGLLCAAALVSAGNHPPAGYHDDQYAPEHGQDGHETATARSHAGHEYGPPPTYPASPECPTYTVTKTGRPKHITVTISSTIATKVTITEGQKYCHPTTATVTEHPQCYPSTTTVYKEKHGNPYTTTVCPDKPCHPSTLTMTAGSTVTSTSYITQPAATITNTFTVTSGGTITSTSYITQPPATVTRSEVSTIYSDRTITTGAPICGGGTTYINKYNATITILTTRTLANTTITSTLYSATSTSTTTVATQTVTSTNFSTTTNTVTDISLVYLPSVTTVTAGNGTVTETQYFPSGTATITSYLLNVSTTTNAGSTETQYIPSGTGTVTSYVLSVSTTTNPGSTVTQYFPSVVTVTAGDGNVTDTVYVPGGTATITSFYPSITTITEPGQTATIYLPSNDTQYICCNNTGGGGGGGGGNDGGNNNNGTNTYNLIVGYLETTYLSLIDRSLTNITETISNRLRLDLQNFFSSPNSTLNLNATISLNTTDLNYLNRTISGTIINFFGDEFNNGSSPINEAIRVEINDTPWWAIVILVLVILILLGLLLGCCWALCFGGGKGKKKKKEKEKEHSPPPVAPPGGGGSLCMRCRKPRSVCGCAEGPL